MQINGNIKEKAAMVAYNEGDYEKAMAWEDDFLADLRQAMKEGEDHCNCPRDCRHHGNCLECIALHRAHEDHLPYCLFESVNKKLYDIQKLTEETIIGKIKEERK